MAKPVVKVFSSAKSKRLADAVVVHLEDDGDIAAWPAVFKLSESFLDDLLQAACSIDFAVVVFAPDDILKMPDGEIPVARDNVVFEAGLFMGALGRERTFIVMPKGSGTIRTPTDLAGITTAQFDASRLTGQDSALQALAPACTKIRARIEQLGPISATCQPSRQSGGLALDEFRCRESEVVQSGSDIPPLTLSSACLRSKRGTLALWVLLPQFGQGFRAPQQAPRYILAHDTNDGRPLGGQGKHYPNVFSLALARSPDPNRPGMHWRLWLCDEAGREWRGEYEDSLAVGPGWHHFCVDWDHAEPRLELAIDGQAVIAASDYLTHWPREFSRRVFVGNWQGLQAVHCVETPVCRVIAASVCLGNRWLASEQANRPG